jgi:CheY-like chemotaxis protein
MFPDGVGSTNEGCPLFAGRKLLVADDSPYYQTVLGLTFSDEGMAVDTTGDGQDALAKLGQSTPDVVLASVSLSGISGYELCERIKQSERFGHIPVMLLVGLHEQFDEAAARRAGADDVVTKPFKSIRQLVGRVGSLLSGKSADTEELGRGYSTLGLGPEPVQTTDTNHQNISDTNVKGGDGAPLMAESEPTGPDVESQAGTSGSDSELQTADTQRLELPDAIQVAAPDVQTVEDTNLKVFVEAASIPVHEPAEPEVEVAGSTCVADVELQTANTQKLERIDDGPFGETIEPIAYAQDDTMELTPAAGNKLDLPSDVFAAENLSSVGVSEMNEETNDQNSPFHSQPIFNDGLLDLGDFDRPTPQFVADDLVLDLEYYEVAGAAAVPEMVAESAPATEGAAPTETPAETNGPEPVYEEQAVFELEEEAIITEPLATETMTASVVAEQGAVEPGLGLSPEAIDAIARRAVELMSEKVVREIAWEVVPELAELLIKKKLEEQK